MTKQTHWVSNKVTVHQELEYRRNKARIALFFKNIGKMSRGYGIRERLIGKWQ